MAENDVNRLIDMLYERVEDAKSPALKPNLSMVDRDEILDLEDLACRLLLQLETSAPGAVVKRYGIPAVNPEQPYETLTEMAKKRGFLAGRGEYDTLRMARIFLDEFRGGKLGRITLELPPEE